MTTTPIVRRALPVLAVLAFACSKEEPSSPAGPTPRADAAAEAAVDSGPGTSSDADVTPITDGATTPDDGAVADVDAAAVDPLAGTQAVALVAVQPATTFQFTEGPLWLPATGKLLFSDVNANTIYELTPPSTVAVFRSNSAGSNGLGLDANGNLLVCEGGGKRLARKNGAAYDTVVDNVMGALTSPNDVIARSDNNIYFTDRGGGRAFRVDPAGQATAFATAQNNPNGIALSPDGNTLYLAEDGAGTISKYPLSAAGVPGTRAAFTANAPGADGLAIDDAGNVYAATTAGIRVFRPAGTVIGTIAVPKRPTNVSFGGVDRRTLYITAQDSLYRVTLNLPGKP